MRAWTFLSPLALALVAGCDDSTDSTSGACEVAISSLSPTSASPGAQVIVRGKPMTTVWDSAVYVDLTRAQLESVDRDGCDACDTCRVNNACTTCSDCDACDTLCASECVETATFVVPSGLSGTTAVRLFNVYGQSQPLDLTVVPLDTGASETGMAETGTPETGEPETGSR